MRLDAGEGIERKRMNIPVQNDVVVLGGGLAGHCAALAAAEHGATVLLLEKTPNYGGSSVQAAGSFAFACTDAQREMGIEDSEEMLEQDIVSASGNRADPVLVRRYVDLQADTYAWLKRQGVEFHKIALSSNMSVPRTHPTNPRQLLDALHAKVMSNARITYVPSVAASRLLRTGHGSAVTVNGVLAGAATNAIEVNARGGVVLAAGGFSRNPQLIERFSPQMAKAMPAGGASNVGDGLLMGWSVGADLLDMSFVNGTFGMGLTRYPDLHLYAEDEALLRLAIYKGAIAVNLEGRRFADESMSYKTLGEICLRQPKAIGFQIFDQKVMDQSEPAPNSHDLADAYKKGLVRKAASISELAGMLDINAGELERTVARYNEGVKKGKDDDFGRVALSKSVGKMVALDTAPYYGFPCATAVLATYCGLRVNADMQVLNVYAEPIEGLYAAGELVGGFHGAGYMSGTALGKAAIFGRVAGRVSAERAAR